MYLSCPFQDNDEDGASVYLISRGIHYQFQTMQEFYDFGFKDSDSPVMFDCHSFLLKENDHP